VNVERKFVFALGLVSDDGRERIVLDLRDEADDTLACLGESDQFTDDQSHDVIGLTDATDLIDQRVDPLEFDKIRVQWVVRDIHYD
jgi:hypothetical protein